LFPKFQYLLFPSPLLPIGLKKLKELDPQFAMTSNLYNVWLYTRRVPGQIKDNRSIILPKSTNGLDNVNNWRPLTISSVY